MSSARGIVVAVCSAWASTVCLADARADSPAPAAEPKPPTPAGPEATAATRSGDAKKALSALQHGLALFDAGKYEEALAEFRASHDEVPSPNSSLLAARALGKLGRAVEAYTAYTFVLAEAEAANDARYAATIKSAQDELAVERAKLGLVTVRVSGDTPGATLTVGGRSIDAAEWGRPTPVAPGKVVVTLAAPSGRNTKLEVNVAAGGETSVDVKLEQVTAPPTKPPPSPEPAVASSGANPRRTAAYVSLGIAGVGITTFTVLVAVAGQKQKGLEIASLLVGALGLGAGAVLYVSGEGATTTSGVPRVRPWVAVGPASLTLGAWF